MTALLHRAGRIVCHYLDHHWAIDFESVDWHRGPCTRCGLEP